MNLRTQRLLLSVLVASLLAPPVGAQVAVAPPAAAAPKGPPAAKAPTTDYADGVFLASDRPVLVRIHLQIGGKPYYASWEVFLDKLFAWFDRDNDGFLNKKEAENVPNFNFLNQHLQGSIGFGRQGQNVKFEEMDTNKDGKISREEFRDYYFRSGFQPLRFNVFNQRSATDQTTGVLYLHLDPEKDGKLTPQKLARAEEALRRLDENEDELISREELTGQDRSYDVAPPAGGPMRAQRVREGEAFIQLRPDQPFDAAVKQILAFYDKDKNGKLSRTEAGLPKELFDALDKNKDDQLDAAELAEFFKRPADLELMMRPGAAASTSEKVLDTIRSAGTQFGWKMPAARRVEVINSKDRPVPGKVQPDEGGLALSLGDANIAMAAEDSIGFSRYANIQRFYLQQFDMADVDKKGVLDKKMAMGTDFLYELFLLADRDGDGKLTRKELSSFLEMMEQGSRCFTVLTVTDYGRDLFDLLDDNHDGRISPREWRTAWTRIKPLSRDGVGLARTDVPRRFNIAAGQGNGFGGGRVRVQRAPGQMGEPSKGPLWFRKMDRNGDGDVSRAEFLGTEEDFRKIDEDGDGLISVEEAIRYEAKLKKSKPAPSGDNKTK